MRESARSGRRWKVLYFSHIFLFGCDPSYQTLRTLNPLWAGTCSLASPLLMRQAVVKAWWTQMLASVLQST